MEGTQLEKFFGQQGLSNHSWLRSISPRISKTEIYHTSFADASDSHLIAAVLKHYAKDGTVKAYVGIIPYENVADAAHEMVKMNYNKAIILNGPESISKLKTRIDKAKTKFVEIGGETNART